MRDGIVAGEELTAPARHVFLSPHYDDIALSVGGTTALLAEAGRRPEVALIFGAHPDPSVPLTTFAESMHRGWGLDAGQVIAGRRAEEAVAGAILGTSDIFLPFRDAIYRGERYTSDEALFDTPAPDESSLPGEIISALDLSPAERGTTRIYAPLGIGRHVDHQQVFVAGVTFARSGWEVWFYEDLPYALRREAREERLENAGEKLARRAAVDVTSTWEKKIAAIMAYPSQLATVFDYVDSGSSKEEIEALMRAYATEAGGGIPAERFWAVQAG
ncbi:MAG TPA: PIG-L family deacetylase [Thermomicrobiales bacterium]|nr:PIG-L family deacetylase [Thermomicrobiales bacterium]